jgi:hypothetical protein
MRMRLSSAGRVQAFASAPLFDHLAACTTTSNLHGVGQVDGLHSAEAPHQNRPLRLPEPGERGRAGLQAWPLARPTGLSSDHSLFRKQQVPPCPSGSIIAVLAYAR